MKFYLEIQKRNTLRGKEKGNNKEMSTTFSKIESGQGYQNYQREEDEI